MKKSQRWFNLNPATTEEAILNPLINIVIQPLRNGLLRKSERNYIHIYGLNVTLGEFELMNQRMSEVLSSLIRLHEHAFAVQPDAVRVLFFLHY